jgi:hypothetical protein
MSSTITVALFDRGDAAASVFQIFPEPRRGGRRIEPAAGFIGNPAQRRRVHGGVEVLGVARRGAEMGNRCTNRLAAARRLDLGFVPPLRLSRQDRAIFAALLASPLHWYVGDGAVRPGDMRGNAGVVQLDEARIDDVGAQRCRFRRLNAVGERRDFDVVGDAIDKPAQQLTPEVLVRHVFDGHRGVHLPKP